MQSSASERKAWSKPELRRIEAGSAEANNGNGGDGGAVNGQKKS